MSDFLRELGYDPLRYWLFAGGTCLLWLASTFSPWNTKGRLSARANSPLVYAIVLLAAMFAWRWPALFHYKPVNADEAQFLAGALATLHRGTLWWIDPTTSGPLVVLPLTLPGLVGLPVDFTHGRLIALLLGWGTVFLGYLTLRHVHGDRNGRVLVMPLACFMTFLLFWDFVPYCSELSPLFLSALASWLCVTAFRADGIAASRLRLAAGGFVLGIIPFSKLQVLPLGAVIGISAVIWIFMQPEGRRKNRGKELLALIGGTALGFLLMLTSLWVSGYWNDVYQSYVVHNLHYTQARGLPWSESGYALGYLTGFSWGFASFHYGMLLLLVLSLVGLRRFSWRPLLLGWALVLAAYLAILVPGRLYPHYLLFLSLPLALVVGLQSGYLFTAPSRAQRFAAIALFLCIGVGPQLIDRAWDRHSLQKLVRGANPRDPVVTAINRLKQPGDCLAVWGWRPEFYVETQLPQATREALTEAQISDHPQRDYYRARFIADLRSNEPTFFIDSVGPDDYLLKDRSLQGHEIIPELAEYIARHYVQINAGASFRVYVRQPRIEPRQNFGATD